MFDKDFYPTPKAVIEQMAIDCYDKVVLEPSAGSGNMVSWLKDNGAREVIACEKHDELRRIVATKCQVIEHDFMNVTAEKVSHIDLIVMNPPFSADEKHILHAWDIAPEGCEIVALCNWETIDKNSYNAYRKCLYTVISNYGEAINLGSVFSIAERKTNVEIGLVRLFKPVVSAEFDWDGFYYTPDQEVNGNGIMPYNEIRAIVNTYVTAVNYFDEVKEIAGRMNALTKSIGSDINVSFSPGNNGYNSVQITSKADFAKSLQKTCWINVFKKMNITKYVTKGVMADINKFIENRSNYPFTMKNIYRMIEIIVGTRDQTMSRAITEAVDKFTKHTHKNRWNVEGWKTNDGHLLNEKFISGWICELNYTRGLGIKTWNGNWQHIEDLTKAICYLTGKNYDDIPNVIANGNCFESNKWYSWGFFDFKVFKKGTGHFRFKDREVWAKLNKAYAEAKGFVLPESKIKKAA